MMMIVLCRYGGKVTLNNKSVDYAEGKAALAKVRKDIPFLELKQTVREACGLNDNNIDINLKWKLSSIGENHELIPIDCQNATDAIFELSGGEFTELFVTTTTTVTAVTENPSESIHENGDGDYAPAGVEITTSNRSKPIITPLEFVHSDPDWVKKMQCNDWEKPEGLMMGSIFLDKKELAAQVKNWHYREGYRYYVDRSTPKSVHYKCRNEFGKCMWSLRATRRVMLGWEITFMGPPHSCKKTDKDQMQIDDNSIVEAIFHTVCADKEVKIAVLQEIVYARFECKVSYPRMWSVKQKVVENILGTQKGAYTTDLDGGKNFSGYPSQMTEEPAETSTQEVQPKSPKRMKN